MEEAARQTGFVPIRQWLTPDARTVSLWQRYALAESYELLRQAEETLATTPSFTKLGIFSATRNEHCSYKSSKIHLRTLPTKAPWVIQGPGENAGVIDIGDGCPQEHCPNKIQIVQ
jgi:phosphoribosylformylglycinamidine (FGAM) synthase-like enzyme